MGELGDTAGNGRGVPSSHLPWSGNGRCIGLCRTVWQYSALRTGGSSNLCERLPRAPRSQCLAARAAWRPSTDCQTDLRPPGVWSADPRSDFVLNRPNLNPRSDLVLKNDPTSIPVRTSFLGSTQLQSLTQPAPSLAPSTSLTPLSLSLAPSLPLSRRPLVALSSLPLRIRLCLTGALDQLENG